MLQVKNFSGFSQRIHDPPGFVTSLQSPTKQIKILNRKTKCFTFFSYIASTDGFSSSCNDPTREQKLLGQNFCSTLGHEFVLQPKDDHKITLQSDLWRKVDAFNRFCRLYSVNGTIIGVTSVSLLPLVSVADLSPVFFLGLLKAVIPMAFMNIYVAGLNQLFDVEIDKVNKPNLPLASGEFSTGQGMAIVSAFGLMCLSMGIMFRSPPLSFGLLIYFLLGTAYSVELPLLRWKKNPFLAALCMMVVSGLTIQLAVFYHIQKYVLRRPIVFTKSLGFAVIFFSLFATILAIFKDIPDVDGDREFGIRSFSVTYGKKKVFWVCISILLIAYGSAVLIGVSSSLLLSKFVTVIGHCILASILWLRAHSTSLDDNASLNSFYMFLWKNMFLFILYAEKKCNFFAWNPADVKLI